MIRLREWRERRGLTQTELAERSDVPQSVISSIERGVTQHPTVTVLMKLAEALDVRLDDLVGEEQPQ